jgi:hypothetical protein
MYGPFHSDENLYFSIVPISFLSTRSPTSSVLGIAHTLVVVAFQGEKSSGQYLGLICDE